VLPPPPAAAEGAGTRADEGGASAGAAAGPAAGDPAAGTAPAPDERGGAATSAGAGGPALELLRGEERLLVVTVHLRTGRLLLAAGAAQGAEVGAECTAALRKARPAVPHLGDPQSPIGSQMQRRARRLPPPWFGAGAGRVCAALPDSRRRLHASCPPRPPRTSALAAKLRRAVSRD
jgi:hypothetical protein